MTECLGECLGLLLSLAGVPLFWYRNLLLEKVNERLGKVSSKGCKGWKLDFQSWAREYIFIPAFWGVSSVCFLWTAVFIICMLHLLVGGVENGAILGNTVGFGGLATGSLAMLVLWLTLVLPHVEKGGRRDKAHAQLPQFVFASVGMMAAILPIRRLIQFVPALYIGEHEVLDMVMIEAGYLLVVFVALVSHDHLIRSSVPGSGG